MPCFLALHNVKALRQKKKDQNNHALIRVIRFNSCSKKNL
jgi:hypothetical protein